MYYQTKEEYIKAYKKQFDCLYEQLKKDGYDVNKQISEEDSKLYNNEYKIIKTYWNAFPNEEFSQTINGVIGNELKKNECQRLLNEKSNFRHLGYEIGSYDSIVEYYFDDNSNKLFIYLYHYDVFRPNSKIYKRHPRFLEAVFESKIEGKVN